MSEHPHLPEIHHESVRVRFGRGVAFLIATTVLLSGVAGYLYTPAATHAGDEALKALKHSAERFEVAARGQEEGYSRLEKLAMAQEYRTRAWAGRQRTANRASIERWENLASQLEAESGIARSDGPEYDPDFPVRFLVARMQTVRKAEKLSALQDAANELSLAWYGKSRLYLAALTTFAVALYLFGQSLTMGRTLAAFLLAAYGAMLLVSGSAITFYTLLTPPRPADESAADEYAQGREALHLADYSRAIEHFDKAITARTTFADAYYYRAVATSRHGSPQATEVYASLVKNPQTLSEVVRFGNDAYQRATRLGLDGPKLVRTLAFDTYSLALHENSQEKLEHSLDLSAKAVDLGPTDPLARYNLGLARLANGEPKKAQHAYDEAVRLDGAKSASLVVSLFTDLEILAGYRAHLKSEVEARKEWLVASTWPGPKPDAQAKEPAISDVELDLYSNRMAWRARLENFDPARDVLTAIWYVSESAGPRPGVWRALPWGSGKINPSRLKRAGQNAAYETNLETCLPSGSYRVEFYVNGRQAGVKIKDKAQDLANLTPVVFRDLNVRICHPTGWQRFDRSTPGVAQGYTSADRKRGVIVFHFPHSPRAPASALRDMEKALAYLREREVLPPNLTPIKQGVAPEHQAAWARYAYPEGEILALAFQRPTIGYVALVFGAGDYVAGNEARRVFESAAIVDTSLE